MAGNKKGSKNQLPKRVKPTDMVPGGFGSRTLRGVAGALGEARQGMGKKPKKKKKK